MYLDKQTNYVMKDTFLKMLDGRSLILFFCNIACDNK